MPDLALPANGASRSTPIAPPAPIAIDDAKKNTLRHQANRDPMFVLAYGKSKGGKSIDLLYSFPRALFIAQRGALRGALTICGYEPANVPVATIPAATRLVKDNTKSDGTTPWEALCIDDVTLLTDNTVSMHASGGLAGYDLWRVVRDDMLAFRRACREAKMHVAMNAHEGPPREFRGDRLRGGPKLPGSMAEELPAACDWVGRAVHEPRRKGWPMGYRCSINDLDYVSGDRNGVTPEVAPMNLGEILRESGFALGRAPGLDWQEAAVEQLAMLLLTNAPETELPILKWMTAELRKLRATDVAIRWTLRDGLDRAALRRARSTTLSGFGV